MAHHSVLAAPWLLETLWNLSVLSVPASYKVSLQSFHQVWDGFCPQWPQGKENSSAIPSAGFWYLTEEHVARINLSEPPTSHSEDWNPRGGFVIMMSALLFLCRGRGSNFIQIVRKLYKMKSCLVNIKKKIQLQCPSVEQQVNDDKIQCWGKMSHFSLPTLNLQNWKYQSEKYLIERYLSLCSVSLCEQWKKLILTL